MIIKLSKKDWFNIGKQSNWLSNKNILKTSRTFPLSQNILNNIEILSNNLLSICNNLINDSNEYTYRNDIDFRILKTDFNIYKKQLTIPDFNLNINVFISKSNTSEFSVSGEALNGLFSIHLNIKIPFTQKTNLTNYEKNYILSTLKHEIIHIIQSFVDKNVYDDSKYKYPTPNDLNANDIQSIIDYYLHPQEIETRLSDIDLLLKDGFSDQAFNIIKIIVLSLKNIDKGSIYKNKKEKIQLKKYFLKRLYGIIQENINIDKNDKQKLLNLIQTSQKDKTMIIKKSSNNKLSIKISKSDWLEIGQQSGWVKTSQSTNNKNIINMKNQKNYSIEVSQAITPKIKDLKQLLSQIPSESFTIKHIEKGMIGASVDFINTTEEMVPKITSLLQNNNIQYKVYPPAAVAKNSKNILKKSEIESEYNIPEEKKKEYFTKDLWQGNPSTMTDAQLEEERYQLDNSVRKLLDSKNYDIKHSDFANEIYARYQEVKTEINKRDFKNRVVPERRRIENERRKQRNLPPTP